ncbi:hypothetical protein IGI04_035742 [Brassica rapa subsp. trilocularis]|uniref:Uncharacterized protein n=1 Tax=Brassica rapa subsp. trilocularis TaxID=1813537 RepID=A0ABQ7LCH3_BRACM|nr:hypothetical protein IGI04_035742 [Brassica rapa subsp. trilocularis]
MSIRRLKRGSGIFLILLHQDWRGPLYRLGVCLLSRQQAPRLCLAEIMPNQDLLVDAHWRITCEALLLRGQVQDMMACRDLLIQQVRASVRWELMREWMEKRVDHWNLEEEYRRHLFLSGGFGRQSENVSQAATPRSDPKVLYLGHGTEVGARGDVGIQRFFSRIRRSWLEPGGFYDLDPEVIRRSYWDPSVYGPLGRIGTQRTVLHLPRQDYYRYLFRFLILPLGSWPPSSSYDVFYFCRKSLTCLKGAGMGVVTQVPGLRCFPRLEKHDLDCSMCFTILLQ